jgi:protein-S-isoprenylcysteine O-methyltransferase Ste14
VRWGRAYFGAQALAGAAWWIAVFTLPVVRETTLGGLDPVWVAVFDVPLFVGASALAAAGWRAAAVAATVWTAIVTAGLAVYATVTTLAGAGVVLMAAATAASVVACFLVVRGRVPTELLLSGPLRLRVAADGGSPLRHAAATAAQIVIFWGLFLGVAPAVIAGSETRWRLSLDLPTAVPITGAVVFALASALGLWAAAAMSRHGRGTPLPSDTAQRLVIVGPYRFVRNPMALAGIVQGAAVGLVLSSWLVVAYAVCGSLMWNYAVRPHEEHDLEARFGESFRVYRRHVRCWWPRLTPVPAVIADAVAADAVVSRSPAGSSAPGTTS